MPSATCLKSVGSLSQYPLATQVSATIKQSHFAPYLKQYPVLDSTISKAGTPSFFGSPLEASKAFPLQRKVHTTTAVQCAMAEAEPKEALSKLTVEDAMVRTLTSSSFQIQVALWCVETF